MAISTASDPIEPAYTACSLTLSQQFPQLLQARLKRYGQTVSIEPNHGITVMGHALSPEQIAPGFCRGCVGAGHHDSINSPLPGLAPDQPVIPAVKLHDRQAVERVER